MKNILRISLSTVLFTIGTIIIVTTVVYSNNPNQSRNQTVLSSKTNNYKHQKPKTMKSISK